MVDTFRRFALAELSRRFPKGGYYTWIVQSTLRRSNEAVKYLIETNESWTEPHPETHYYPEDSEYFSITAASLPPTPDISDDESEYSYHDTETDGSSLHTTSWPPLVNALSTSPSSRSREYIPKRQDSITCTPRRFASPAVQIEHGRLILEIERLDRLIRHSEDVHAQEEFDIRNHFAMLEARVKRRAWLNKDLKGGARCQVLELVELAAPFRSSPLAQCSWTEDDAEDVELLAYDTFDRNELKIKRTKPHRPTGIRLFPVSEESEVDDTTRMSNVENEKEHFEEPKNLQLTMEDFEIDLEDGLYDPNLREKIEDEEGRSALEVERPQHRPRVRTSSMYKQRIVTPVEPPLPTAHRAHSPSALDNSIECPSPPFDGSSSPVHDIMLSAPPEVDTPPAYTEVDVAFNVDILDHGINGVAFKSYNKQGSGEFTLAMDSPLGVRMQGRAREELKACWEGEE
jgi:hypothetical protein